MQDLMFCGCLAASQEEEEKKEDRSWAHKLYGRLACEGCRGAGNSMRLLQCRGLAGRLSLVLPGARL